MFARYVEHVLTHTAVWTHGVTRALSAPIFRGKKTKSVCVLQCVAVSRCCNDVHIPRQNRLMQQGSCVGEAVPVVARAVHPYALQTVYMIPWLIEFVAYWVCDTDMPHRNGVSWVFIEKWWWVPERCGGYCCSQVKRAKKKFKMICVSETRARTKLKLSLCVKTFDAAGMMTC